MFEFTAISVLIGIILGVGFGIVHGIFSAYSATYDKNLIGDITVDMDLKLANARRETVSEADIKASFAKTERSYDKKTQTMPLLVLLFMFIPIFIAIAMEIFH